MAPGPWPGPSGQSVDPGSPPPAAAAFLSPSHLLGVNMGPCQEFDGVLGSSVDRRRTSRPYAARRSGRPPRSVCCVSSDEERILLASARKARFCSRSFCSLMSARVKIANSACDRVNAVHIPALEGRIVASQRSTALSRLHHAHGRLVNGRVDDVPGRPTKTCLPQLSSSVFPEGMRRPAGLTRRYRYSESISK